MRGLTTMVSSAVVMLIGLAAVAAPRPDAYDLALVNRVTWGVDPADAAAVARMGPDRWLEHQLKPSPKDRLPPEAQARIDALPVTQEPAAALLVTIDAKHKSDLAAAANPDQKDVANTAYQKAMSDLGNQAMTRSLLRDLYSPDQLQEQMTWFWFNHFNVHLAKANVRVLVGDYEDEALRPRALGKFRDLLEASLRHPAMLQYLDNAQNASGKINENYAREIMELHTMGVGSGYTQKDVQELARILTGVGIDESPQGPRTGPQHAGELIRQGVFEFNPNRHDYGDKVFLGHVIEGRGFGEVEEALDILSRQPATARHVSRQLALYFVSDTPPEALVQRMAAIFTRTDGDTAQVLRTLFKSPEFKASLGTKFKDPMHFVVSAVRLAYPDRIVTNIQPMQSWLNRLGEGLYNHETPDGYSMTAAAWNGPGQMGDPVRDRPCPGLQQRRPVPKRSARNAAIAPAPRPHASAGGLHRWPRRRLGAVDAGRPDQGRLAASLQCALPVLARLHAAVSLASRIETMNRRDLLKVGAMAGPLIVAGHAFAASQTKQKLLVVFLRGAYDAASVVIPTSSDFYYASRPNIAIARPNPADPSSALPLDADWSLHPALKDSIYPLWRKKQVAFVPFAGTDDLTRSHFETQDTIELGQPVQGSRTYGSGFMSRLAGTLNGGVQPIAFTTQVPLTFRGGAPIPNIALQGISKPAIDDKQAKLIADMYQNTTLHQSVTEGFKVNDEVYRSVASEMTAANRGAVSGQGVRAFGASDRAADDGSVQPRLCRRRRLGHPRQPRRRQRLSRGTPEGTRGGSRGLRRRDRARWLERHHGGRDQRVRPHVSGKRQSRHRSRPWQRLLGHGRTGARRPRPRRSRHDHRGRLVPEPRLAGDHRLPRPVRRPVSEDLRARPGATGNGVSGRPGEKSATRVNGRRGNRSRRRAGSILACHPMMVRTS